MTSWSRAASSNRPGRISKARLGKVVDALKELGDIPPGFATERLFLPEVTELTE